MSATSGHKHGVFALFHRQRIISTRVSTIGNVGWHYTNNLIFIFWWCWKEGLVAGGFNVEDAVIIEWYVLRNV